MRIDSDGTPIYVTSRFGKGIAISQGRSKVMLSAAEAGALLQALSDVAPQGGWPVNR